MSEITPPRIESTYFLKNNETILASITDAAVHYDQTRPVEEGFVFEHETVNNDELYVVFGRTVLKATAYAEVGRELDLMQTEIESFITTPEEHEIVVQGRAGLHLYGLLAD